MTWFKTLWRETRTFDHVMFWLIVGVGVMNGLAFLGLVPWIDHPDFINAALVAVMPLVALNSLQSVRCAIKRQKMIDQLNENQRKLRELADEIEERFNL